MSNEPDEAGTPLWKLYDHRPILDVVPCGSFHMVGNTRCWCLPKVTIEYGEGGTAAVLITHQQRPHNWVSGQMKADAISMQPGLADRDSVVDIVSDPDVMICETCGAIDDQTPGDSSCIGPAAAYLIFTSEEDDTEKGSAPNPGE
jgi:hypothetical protein